MLEREAKAAKAEMGWREFASLLGSLPLEKCSRECNPVTKEWGWKAPRNKAFKLSGHFVVYTHQSDVEQGMCRPIESADLLKDEYKEKYANFLKIAEENENEALNLLYEDVLDGYFSAPIISFNGKWLSISPDLKEIPSNEERSLSVPDLNVPELMVGGDTRVEFEKDFFHFIKDIAPQSPTITEVFFLGQARAVMHWSQDYAEAILGKCKIELVDLPEEGKDIKVAASEFKNDNHLYLPSGVNNGKHSEYEFEMSTSRRPNKREGKQLQTFNKNSGLIFSQPWDSDLLIARRAKKVILPEKKKKERKSQNISF